MTEEQAWALVSELVLVTQGWDEESVSAFAARIEQWESWEAGANAIDQVIDTHQSPGRPAWATLNEAYRIEARRLVMERPAISTPGHYVSPSEGRQIAAKSYARECASRDPRTDPHILSGFRSREPNPVFLDRFLKVPPADGT